MVLGSAESSEALLGGQKPPLQLLVTAVDAQGQRIDAIPPLLSDEFVVHSLLSSATAVAIAVVATTAAAALLLMLGAIAHSKLLPGLLLVLLLLPILAAAVSLWSQIKITCILPMHLFEISEVLSGHVPHM